MIFKLINDFCQHIFYKWHPIISAIIFNTNSKLNQGVNLNGNRLYQCVMFVKTTQKNDKIMDDQLVIMRSLQSNKKR